MTDAQQFKDVVTYIDALAKDPTLAIVSKKMAGVALGITRPAIAARIKNGSLATIEIGGAKHPRASALISARAQELSEITIIREFLEGIAARREVVTYEPVMGLLGMKTDNPHHRTKIGILLGELSRATYYENGILLSVLVHLKKPTGRSRPSSAFDKLIDEFDLDVPNVAAFIDEEIEEVWELYANKTA
jgi:hypothetical protein